MRSIEANGLRVSRVGLGTWQFGSREWGYGEDYAREVAPALIRRALELGITMIDTAEVYGPAHSERIIGETLANPSLALPPHERAKVTVATKFMPVAPAEPILAWQCAGSRRRLQVDALDLYYAHWPNPFVSARRVMQSVRPLVEAGLVKRVAVSNYPLEMWQRAEQALGAPVIANQVRFSLVSPGPAAELVPWASSHDRLVVAYSPLGQGMLSQGRDPQANPKTVGMRRYLRLEAAEARRLVAIHAVLGDVARTNDASWSQVALAWVLGHPNTVAIPGARTLEQLEMNAEAADLVLSDDEMGRLTEAAVIA
jgi:aryl-alcohol dehydrogenase-like predicted oxidoreductase